MPGSHSSPSIAASLAIVSAPIDVATRETTAFLDTHLPRGARVLEVGCGAGDVALALGRLGHRVIAIDADAETVAQARARGVDARCAAWPEFECGPADAVAFTRSLHHIGALGPAIDAVREVLGVGGVLLVEDFAFGEVVEEALRGFVDRLRGPSARALLLPTEGELVTELVGSADPMRAWRERHDLFELHEAGAMLSAVSERFARVEAGAVPYLYRYLVRVVPESTAATTLVEETLTWEVGLGEGAWIGRRIVARGPRSA